MTQPEARNSILRPSLSTMKAAVTANIKFQSWSPVNVSVYARVTALSRATLLTDVDEKLAGDISDTDSGQDK